MVIAPSDFISILINIYIANYRELFAIFDARRDRNKCMLIKDFKLNYVKITFQSLFGSK